MGKRRKCGRLFLIFTTAIMCTGIMAEEKSIITDEAVVSDFNVYSNYAGTVETPDPQVILNNNFKGYYKLDTPAADDGNNEF